MAPAPQFTLRQALSLAAENDPRLQGETFARAAANARRDHAALRPALTLTAEAENVLGTGALSTFDDMEATLSLGTTLELGAKRARRSAVADGEAAVVEAELAAQRLDILAEVARRFIAVLQAQENLAAARAGKELAARDGQAVGARVAAGVALGIERANADVAAAQADLAERTASSAVREAWGQLVVTWSGAPDSTGAAQGNLFAAPALPAFENLETALDRNPDIVRFISERRVREAALGLAEAQGTPDITVTAGVRRLQSVREQALVLSASVPLGAGGRAAPGAAEARAKLAALPGEERAKRNELLATLHGLRLRAVTARETIAMLDATVLPAAMRAQDQAENAFGAGRLSLLELNASRRQLLDLRRERIAAAANYHLLIIDIERLMGQPIAALEGP